MESASRDKLAEASYFLKQMRRLQNRPGTRDQFRYHLNAFLGACRGLTHRVLVEEYQHAKHVGSQLQFQKWFDDEWCRLRKTNSLDFLVEARNITVHQQPLYPRAVYSDTCNVTGRVRVSVETVTIRADGSVMRDEPAKQPNTSPRISEPPNRPKRSNAGSTTRYYFRVLQPTNGKNAGQSIQPPADDVLTVCSKALAALEQLLQRAEQQFELP